MARTADAPFPTVTVDTHPQPWSPRARLVVALERLPLDAYLWDDEDDEAVVWDADGIVLSEPFDTFTAAPWTVNGTCAIIPGGRTGNGAQVTGAVANNLAYTIPDGYRSNVALVGFAWRAQAGTAAQRNVVEFYTDANTVRHTRVVFNVAQTITIYRDTTALVTTTATFNADTWYWVELRTVLHDTAGSVELRVDGTTVAVASNVDTRNGGVGTTYDTMRLVVGAAALNSIYDDLVLQTGAGAVFRGDVGLPTPSYVWDNPLNAAGYTDVWCDLTGLELSHGEPDEQGLMATGEATLGLRDPGDGRYRTRDASGRLVYYAPGRRLSIWAQLRDPITSAVTKWWLFNGRISQWVEDLTGGISIVAHTGTAELAQPPGKQWSAGSAGQLPAARLAAIAAAFGYTGRTRFDSGINTLATIMSDESPLEAMQRVSWSDGGVLYSDADDTLLYRDRNWHQGRSDQTAVPVVSDNVCGDGVEVVLWEVEGGTDDTRLAAQVVISNTAGLTATVTNPNSTIATGTTYGHPDDDLWQSQGQGDNLATAILAMRSDPRLAIDQARIYLHDGRYDYWSHGVDRRVGDRIRFLHEDTFGDELELLDLGLVVGTVRHLITATEWITEWETTPVVTWERVQQWNVTPWVYDDDDAVWR